MNIPRLIALAVTLALAACATPPVAPENYEFRADWGYVVVTKDAPDIGMEPLHLCRIGEDGTYTVSVVYGVGDCHPRRPRGVPARAIDLFTTEGSVSTDRRIQLPNGSIAHIIPYAPFDFLAIRYDPIPGDYAIAVRGQKEKLTIAQGDVPIVNLTGTDIVYLGHVAPDGTLAWRAPGDLRAKLSRVPGYADSRYRDAELATGSVSCSGSPETLCQLN